MNQLLQWQSKQQQSFSIINSKKTRDIDLLIICTQNPDYRLPTTACIVQNKLDLKNSCIAFDINLGCSGFIYSIAVAG